MTIAILGLLGALIPFIIYLVRRKLDHVETPEDRILENHKAVENEIVHDDEDAANVRVDDMLGRLRARQSNQPGSPDSTPKT